MGLDLGPALLDELGDQALELRAELREGAALLLARCGEPLCVGAQTCVVLDERLLLPLAELAELRFQLALAAVEVGRPACQPALETLLGASHGFCELDAGAFGLPLDRVASLLRELALLLAERVARVRALPREHALDLHLSLLRVLLEVLVDPVAGLLPEPLRVADPLQAAGERKEPRFGESGDEDAAGGDDENLLVPVPLDDRDSGEHGRGERRDGQADRRA